MPTGRPSVQQLIYFLAAVEYRSFAAAAEALYLAQPSLSDQVSRLESRLGVTLFTRTNRQLQLTDAGRMLIPWAEKVVRDVDDLTAAVRDVRELAGGLVRDVQDVQQRAPLPAPRPDRRLRSAPPGRHDPGPGPQLLRGRRRRPDG